MDCKPKLRFPEFSGEWEEKKLGNIADIVGGGTPRTDNPDYWNGGIDWYTPSEVGKKKYVNSSERKISKNGLINSSAKLLPLGTVLLSSRATIGEMSILQSESTTNQGFQSLIMNKNNSNEFVYYLGNKFKKYLLKKASGSTFLEISNKEVGKIKVNIPSLPEQQKIASFLSKVDSKIDLLEKKQELWETYKKGIMQQIFSQKLRFKDENGEDYPDWESKRIEQIANVFKGFTPSTHNVKYWNGGIPWLSIADMNQGKYLIHTSRTISNEGCKNKRIIPKGTLVMSFKLTLGRLGILNLNMYSNEAICNFQWKQDIETEYMFYYLSSIDVRTFGSQAAKGITLNNESLNSIVVKIPDKKEQIKISNFLSAIDHKIINLDQELEMNKKFKEGLFQQMFG